MACHKHLKTARTDGWSVVLRWVSQWSWWWWWWWWRRRPLSSLTDVFNSTAASSSSWAHHRSHHRPCTQSTLGLDSFSVNLPWSAAHCWPDVCVAIAHTFDPLLPLWLWFHSFTLNCGGCFTTSTSVVPDVLMQCELALLYDVTDRKDLKWVKREQSVTKEDDQQKLTVVVKWNCR